MCVCVCVRVCVLACVRAFACVCDALSIRPRRPLASCPNPPSAPFYMALLKETGSVGRAQRVERGAVVVVVIVSGYPKPTQPNTGYILG